MLRHRLLEVLLRTIHASQDLLTLSPMASLDLNLLLHELRLQEQNLLVRILQLSLEYFDLYQAVSQFDRLEFRLR